jgi:hypothetical protein
MWKGIKFGNNLRTNVGGAGPAHPHADLPVYTTIHRYVLFAYHGLSGRSNGIQ